MTKHQNLTEGAISGHLFRLSGVMIIGFIAWTLGGLIEIFYLGMVGLDALAAITFAFPLTMSLTAFIRGIGVGASSIIARALGESDRDKAATTTSHCNMIVILITVTLSLLGFLTAEIFYLAMGARNEVLNLAVAYTQIWLLGFPMIGMAMVSNGMIRSFGDASFSASIMLSAPLVQIILGPFLIFGWLGLPALGVIGAAWVAVIGGVCQFVIGAYWFFIKEKLLRAEFPSLWSSCKDILHVGIPAASTNLIGPLSTGITTWLLSGYGIAVVAGFGVASRIESVAGMVTVGFATSIVPIVGQNWGARKFDRVYAALKTCYLACHAWGLIAATGIWMGAVFLVRLFSDQEAILESAVWFLYIVPLSIGFAGMVNIATHSFNALRTPLPALVLSLARVLFVYVPLAAALQLWIGYQGVFIAIALSNMIVGLLAYFWNNYALEKRIHGLVND